MSLPVALGIEATSFFEGTKKRYSVKPDPIGKRQNIKKLNIKD